MTKVYLRPRPLAECEQGDEAVGFVFEGGDVHVEKADKSFKNFAGVLSTKNSEAYSHAIRPLVPGMFTGTTSCCFAYGHTNSGKTHTIFGYDQELGMCQRLVHELFTSEHKPLVQVRFYELYNGQVFDLLNDRTSGFVREDADGTIHVRSATTMGPNGEVLTQALHAEYGESAESILEIIRRGRSLRAEGTSELHQQSSRSHAVLELEIVTKELAALRQQVALAQSRVTPIGKARDDLFIAVEMKRYLISQGKSDEEPTQEELARLEDLRARTDAAEAEVAGLKKRVAFEKARSAGGAFVLVDLAGAEYLGQGLTRDPKERKEAREINSSLLALKECIRAQSLMLDHIPYRNSKLTMILKSFLNVKNASSTVMIANVSSSEAQLRKSLASIGYTELVANAFKNKKRQLS